MSGKFCAGKASQLAVQGERTIVHYTPQDYTKTRGHEKPFNALKPPETRLVLFGQIIFKIKYRLSHQFTAAEEEMLQTPQLQGDIKRLTEGILFYLCKSGNLQIIRSDQIFMFPDSTPWQLANGDLDFLEDGKCLLVHPDTILLTVVVVRSSCTPSKVAADSTMADYTRKRLRPSDDEMQQKHAKRQRFCNISRPSLSLERMKMHHNEYGQVPCANKAALPTSNTTASSKLSTPTTKATVDGYAYTGFSKLFGFLLKPLSWTFSWEAKNSSS